MTEKKQHGGFRLGAGRPKGATKTKSLCLASSEEEYERIKYLAKKKGKSISRLMIEATLGKYPENSKAGID